MGICEKGKRDSILTLRNRSNSAELTDEGSIVLVSLIFLSG